MKNKYKLGTFFGIGVYVHWTFAFLLGWVLLFQGGLLGALFLTAFFACIVAHEYGHVLMARYFGIQTRDITLYPIGGIAALRSMPKRPAEEMLVALAGPAVNVVIAAVLALFLFVSGVLTSEIGGVRKIAETLVMGNLILAGFNLLPAFPMDGGRVLRAWLARRHDYATATDIAAKVGRFFALLFAIAAVMFQAPMLLILALFVYVVAGAERRQALLQRDSERFREMFRQVPFSFPGGAVRPNTTRFDDGQVIDVEAVRFDGR